MLAGICIGTNDLTLAGQFYDQVLASVGMSRTKENDIEIGYASADGRIVFWVLTPYDKQAASNGNGTQIMFQAKTRAEVDHFHMQALSLGGADAGAPGPRDYYPNYYGAYCRDLDGNKLHVFHRP